MRRLAATAIGLAALWSIWPLVQALADGAGIQAALEAEQASGRAAVAPWLMLALAAVMVLGLAVRIAVGALAVVLLWSMWGGAAPAVTIPDSVVGPAADAACGVATGSATGAAAPVVGMACPDTDAEAGSGR